MRDRHVTRADAQADAAMEAATPAADKNALEGTERRVAA